MEKHQLLKLVRWFLVLFGVFFLIPITLLIGIAHKNVDLFYCFVMIPIFLTIVMIVAHIHINLSYSLIARQQKSKKRDDDACE